MNTSGGDSGLPRNGERRDAAARTRRAMGCAAKLSVAASLVGLACGVASSPWLRVEQVVVRCSDLDVAQEAAAAARVKPGATLVTAPLWRLSREIGACPRVKRVTVRRRWQHALDVDVVPREPAVAVVAESGCVLADEAGVCIRRVRARPTDLPVVRGPGLDGIGPGDTVSRARMALAWQCLEWAERLPALGRISVDISAPQRVCVYSGDGTKGIIGRPTDLGRKLACFAAALEHLRERGWRAQYVDVQDIRVGALWRPALHPQALPSSGEA